MGHKVMGHKVTDCGMGYNVKIHYRGYTISLAADGADIWVLDSKDEYVWGCDGTDGESVREAIEFINGMV